MKPIGIIGGTGFDDFIQNHSGSRTIGTSYGLPSSPVFYINLGGRDVRFIYRHGLTPNKFPPQFVNYAANMKVLKDEGCDSVIVTTAVGELILPENVGKIAVPHQLVDYTEGRRRTLYENQITHVEFANPYCERLRQMIIAKANRMNLNTLADGTIAVISGNRFSTAAEHSRYKRDGCTLVGMTQCPESTFARELEMCYAAIAIVTDYAINAQDPPGMRETTHEEVIEKFAANIGNVTRLLEELLPEIPESRDCTCSTALSRAMH